MRRTRRRRSKRGGAKLKHLTYKDLPNKPWSFGTVAIGSLPCNRPWLKGLKNNKEACITFILFAGAPEEFTKTYETNPTFLMMKGAVLNSRASSNIFRDLSKEDDILSYFLRTRFGSNLNIGEDASKLSNADKSYAILKKEQTRQTNAPDTIGSLPITYLLFKDDRKYYLHYKCDDKSYYYDGESNPTEKPWPSSNLEKWNLAVYGNIHTTVT